MSKNEYGNDACQKGHMACAKTRYLDTLGLDKI